MRLELLLVAFAAVFVAASPARADPSCEVETREVEFGAYDAFERTPNDGVGEIRVTCECRIFGCGDFAYNVSLGSGQANDPDRRRMGQLGGRQTLNYQLYSDPQRTRVWATGARSVTRMWDRRDFGETAILPVYGRILPFQSTSAGFYADLPLVLIIY